MIKKLIAKKVKLRLSRSHVRNIIGPLREMFNHAIDDDNGVVLFNPGARIGRFNQRRDEDRKIDPLTREEITVLLKTAKEKLTLNYPLLLCAARTGLRAGEVVALQWGDIDFNGRFIEVRRNMSKGKLSSPKNHKTRRVDMRLQLTNTLDELLAKRKAEALKREYGKHQKDRRNDNEVLSEVMDGFVFTTSEGKPLDPNNMRRQIFYRALDLAELRRVRFHDLRHTFTSLLIQQGESLAYIKDQMGHYSIQMTIDTYGHLVPGTNRQAVDRLDDVGEDRRGNIGESGSKTVAPRPEATFGNA